MSDFNAPRLQEIIAEFRGYEGQEKLELLPEAVLKLPGDFYREIGLHQVLTHQRLNGMAAMIAHLKRLTQRALTANSP
jgi:cysteine desulfuration protein SufE